MCTSFGPVPVGRVGSEPIRSFLRFQETNAIFTNPQSTILNQQFLHSFLIRFFRITKLVPEGDTNHQ
jgi:hypothetical protein